MAPRRTHTKSRKGCVTCKKRRVKCDETGPPCTNCMRRCVQCVYSENNTIQRHGSTSGDLDATPPLVEKVEESIVSLRSGTPPSLNDVGSETRDFTRALELELMHHYATETYRTFGDITNAPELWRVYVVREALNYDFLMDAILALSSFHKASVMPQMAPKYVSAALEYQNLASSSVREALLDINQENCRAIFASSIVTLLCVIASPAIPSESTPKSFLETMFVCFDLLQGVSSIAKHSSSWLRPGPFEPLFDLWVPPSGQLQDEDARTALNRLKELNDGIMANGKDQHAVNKHAIESLEANFIRGKVGTLVWLTVAKDFANALRRREPMALLIFMYWGVLLDQQKECWWAKDSGRNLVNEISIILRDYKPIWEDAAQWAVRRVGVHKD